MTELHIGNLPLDVRDTELFDMFEKYRRNGDILGIKVMRPKFGNRATFAFVMFESAQDAKEACGGRDGIKFADNFITVTLSKAALRDAGLDDRRGGREDRQGGRDDRQGGRDDRRGGRDERRDRGGFADDGSSRDRKQREAENKRTRRRPGWDHCVFIDGLPSGITSQELEDAIAAVFPDPNVNLQRPRRNEMEKGTLRRGTMWFPTLEAAENAITALNGTQISTASGETSTMAIRMAPPRQDRGRNAERKAEQKPGDRKDARSRSPAERGNVSVDGAEASTTSVAPASVAPALVPAASSAVTDEDDWGADMDAPAPAAPVEDVVLQEDADEEIAAPTPAPAPAGAPTPASAAVDYESMSFKELQAACKKAGIKASGKKTDLIARLNEGN